jgi:hypothetical protein
MIYTYLNKKTKEEQDFEFTYEQMLTFEANKSNMKKWERVFKPVAFGDSIRLGIKKPPADFMKNVIGRVRDKVPGAKTSINRSRFQIPKEF